MAEEEPRGERSGRVPDQELLPTELGCVTLPAWTCSPAWNLGAIRSRGFMEPSSCGP